MKKVPFKKLALLGIVSGVLAAQNLEAATSALSSLKEKSGKEEDDPNSQNLGYHLMTEDELLSELNDEGYKLYMSLTPEGKALARKMASAACNGTNGCEGENACKSEKNDCAGKGKCKGQGKCAFSDKNLAVKIAAKKMAEKRSEALRSNP